MKRGVGTVLTKVPEGSREVIRVLLDDQLYTLEEIAGKLDKFELGTIRYAIRRLLETRLIQSIPDLYDMRTVKYRIASESTLSTVLNTLPPEVYREIEDLFSK